MLPTNVFSPQQSENNFLKGSIPLSLGNLASLQDFEQHRLSGEIPRELGKLYNLITMELDENQLRGSLPLEIGNLRKLERLDLSFNQLTGEIPKAVENVTTMLLTGNMLEGPIPPLVDDNWDLSYNNFSILPSNDSRNKSHAPKPNIKPSRNYTLEARTKFCKGKSKYYSLFINCGGASLPFEGNQYDGDVSQAKFCEGPAKSKEKRWAYSCSGEFLSSYANSSDYIKNKTCGVSEESLHETARLCPVSLTYYGFCLHKGNYTVKLHFAEIVYSKDEDYSSSGKRIFDVYIQGERKLKDFSIKDKAKDPNKALIEEFVAHVDDNLLEIHFHWAGKGSMYTSPLLNGPLVSGISVTPNSRITVGFCTCSNSSLGFDVENGLARVYVAPEYALGQPITDKADVYSFGVVALEIFSGRSGIEYKPNQEAATYLTDDARIAHARGKMFGLVIGD
ncbi:hypothetical protein GH714_038290 [Hevea brasiliensis]|uniref:non-specific serine/threonine protein kinase n=1 Tax=Hevea brasiliensis TaxID=3981 RepID=A0A6A6LDT3_HEVBR|nr:hypothetical protein GH714_038290 [Hevea brasiliensis]